jgi:hypothetical protein
MSQILHHSSNAIARITIFGAVFVIGFIGWAGYQLDLSHHATRPDILKRLFFTLPSLASRHCCEHSPFEISSQK